MDPVVAFDKAFELAERIGGLVEDGLAERGLTPGRAGLLLVLDRTGGPLVQRELARHLGCTPRHVTALVDVLERDGWVERGAHPTDRRATLVRLTERGRETADWMASTRRLSAEALLGGLDPADLAAFVTVADRLIAHFPQNHPPVA